MPKRVKTAIEIEIQEKAKNALIEAIKRNGEGTRVGTRKTYFEEFGQRLHEPKPGTLFEFKCWVAKEGVFSMESTNPQINAYYLDGEVVVAHHGYDRHKVVEKVNYRPLNVFGERSEPSTWAGSPAKRADFLQC